MWSIMLPVTVLVAAASGIPCDEARMKCAFRFGCGNALNNYIAGCSGVLQIPKARYCPEICHESLIALISTKEGNDLMECECSDKYCEEQKQRTEICRPAVSKMMESPVIPCRVAQWICNADAQCATAFEYYHHYCKSMFHGKKCTPKCLNSIGILLRQQQATKLKKCACDGSEEYNCIAIQQNMNKLCFHHHYNVTTTFELPIENITVIPEVIQVDDDIPPPPDSASACLVPAITLTVLLHFWMR